MHPLSRNSFLVLGRAGMDLYADPPGTRIEEAQSFAAHLGGSAANIAVALARQGAAADLLTRVSDDAVGRFCLAQLDHYGIGRAHVGLTRGENRTSLAVVETRAVDCQSIIYRNGAADFALTEADVASHQFRSVRRAGHHRHRPRAGRLSPGNSCGAAGCHCGEDRHRDGH
jgi:5-dehydro-2-deoxygluconokinase